METRITVLGHLQRGGTPNTEDRLLANRFGTFACHMALKKQYKHIACLQNNTITAVPYEKIKKWERKKINLLNEYLLTAEGIGICMGR